MIMVAVTFSVFIMLGCQGVMNSTRALFSQDPAEVENEPTPGQNLAESEISTLSPAPTSEIKEEIRQGP